MNTRVSTFFNARRFVILCAGMVVSSSRLQSTRPCDLLTMQRYNATKVRRRFQAVKGCSVSFWAVLLEKIRFLMTLCAERKPFFAEEKSPFYDRKNCFFSKWKAISFGLFSLAHRVDISYSYPMFSHCIADFCISAYHSTSSLQVFSNSFECSKKRRTCLGLGV